MMFLVCMKRVQDGNGLRGCTVSRGAWAFMRTFKVLNLTLIRAAGGVYDFQNFEEV